MPKVLYWGRADLSYSRNSILLQLMRDLGWTLDFFHPHTSRTGVVEAAFHKFHRPDVIWVPCFRHRDIASAAVWKKKLGVPLVVDPLISAWEKEVIERRKWPLFSKAAERRRAWERDLYRKADRVVLDTKAHADFFSAELAVSPEKISVLYLGAETDRYFPVIPPSSRPPYEILFYGSFLPLQGVEVVVKAAALARDLPAVWVMVGDGDQKNLVQKMANGLPNVRFEPWIENGRLNSRIAKADILLGIFGPTPKADIVIPNKVFQAMAAGRPLITRRASAFQGTLEGSDVIGWVEPDDPGAVANLVREWLEDPSQLHSRGLASRRLFEKYFRKDKLAAMLSEVSRQVLSTRPYSYKTQKNLVLSDTSFIKGHGLRRQSS